jgi:hypothetical protein
MPRDNGVADHRRAIERPRTDQERQTPPATKRREAVGSGEPKRGQLRARSEPARLRTPPMEPGRDGREERMGEERACPAADATLPGTAPPAPGDASVRGARGPIEPPPCWGRPYPEVGVSPAAAPIPSFSRSRFPATA